ncbi:HD domain-containing protein [Streptomyces sp. LaBMicrA B280]|uniref:wHTH domain-containing protein n=1 Tax=Streptomyces sp. LaBMicrA B280 TaxID=3391001 RepID=UPI003BA5463A
MTGRKRYEDEVRLLFRAAGSPSETRLAREIKKWTKAEVSVATLQNWCECKGVPRRTDKLAAFWRTLGILARERDPRARVLPSEEWNLLLKEARRRRDEKPCSGGGCDTSDASELPGLWRQLAQGSEAWSLVAPAAAERADALRAQAADIAHGLAELHDSSRGLLDRDPWYDPDVARRTVRWTDLRLAGIRDRLGTPSLSAAEAALIALLPFLYQTRHAQTAAELSAVDPANLEERAERAGDDPARAAFDAVLVTHERLVRAAIQGAVLPDRGDGRAEVGWWLFHQWVRPLAAQPDRLTDVLDDLGTVGTGLGTVGTGLGAVGADLATVLEHPCLPWLLSCAHLGPRELFRAPHDASPYLDFGGHDAQRVRTLLVGPLFAIGHAMAIEVTDLPSTVVHHVGIPEPLVPAQLLARINRAEWQPAGDTLALDAPVDHPAAVAALTEHARHVDALLREARRALPTEEIGALPVYAHADRVREVDERTGRPRQAGEVIRFRLDEERIQELLMGENLYRDRALAIRELYQNALDACRYGRAYQYRRDGRDTFQGRITFRQGYDPVETRHFLECQDEGIGMDETVLAEVFSRAGVRFGDHPRSRDWADGGGLAVRPNSRFGIGVLSYFMLADEIRVTTCPMDTREGPQEQLTVLITGPGHYFRVRRTGRWGPVGTTVRLYLRDGKDAPSCVRELRRLLGVTEFPVTVEGEGGQESAAWEPGVLNPRESAAGRYDGFVAHGRTVSWPQGAARADGQVIWCEHGGGILADGIFIESRVRRGVLTDWALRGVVVNLTGASRPRALSVDRSEILDPDVDQEVERLIRAALPTLLAADPPLLSVRWLTEVAQQSPRLGDLVAEESGKAGVELDLRGHPAKVATAGFFAPDTIWVHSTHRDRDWEDQELAAPRRPDDATLLWRLLAHAPNADLAALACLVPELSRVRGVLPARPSDVLLRSEGGLASEFRSWIDPAAGEEPVRPGHVLSVARTCGTSYEEALGRMERLGLPVPARPLGPVAVDAPMTALVDRELRGMSMITGPDADHWLPLADPVSPGHFAKAYLMLNIRVQEAMERMRVLGFRVPERGLPTGAPDHWVVRLLSRFLNGGDPWLPATEPVRAGHLLWAMRALGRPFGEIVATLTDYGLSPAPGRLDERSARELLRLGGEWGWDDQLVRLLDMAEPVHPSLLLHASLHGGEPLSGVVCRLRELGFTVGALPERVEDTDHALLLGRGVADRVIDTEVPLRKLVERAEASGLSPAAAAARLHAYGLRSRHTMLPDRLDPDDRNIFEWVHRFLPIGGNDLTTCTVPMVEAVRAAKQLRLSARAVLDCFRRYGVRVDWATVPGGPGHYDLDLFQLRRHGRPLDLGGPVPLFHLVNLCAELFLPPETVVSRLAEFGLQADARAMDELDETDLKLCRDDFGPNEIGLPLDLEHPVTDFLDIACYAGLPLPELLPRLTRLGVDLTLVAEAVRAALPRVPGLVMAPGGEPATTAATAPRSPAT